LIERLRKKGQERKGKRISFHLSRAQKKKAAFLNLTMAKGKKQTTEQEEDRKISQVTGEKKGRDETFCGQRKRGGRYPFPYE